MRIQPPILVKQLAFAATICVATAACSDLNFESVTRVSKVRVVNLEMTPPDVAPLETAQIAGTLVHPPEQNPTLHYEWKLCVFDGGSGNYFECPDELPSLPLPNILFESTDAAPQFVQEQFTDEALRTICDSLASAADSALIPAEFAASLPRCVTGLPVRLRLKVCEDQPDCDNSKATIISKKVNLIFEAFRDRADRNENPVIYGLTIGGVEATDTVPLEVLLDGAETELEVELAAHVLESAQRFYAIDAKTGVPEDEESREELQTDWYSTAGDYKGSRRYFREGRSSDVEFRRNTITFKQDSVQDGQSVMIWVTLRDSRGGSAHIQREIVLRK